MSAGRPATAGRALLVTLLGLTGCVRLTWQQEVRHEPVPEAAVATLRRGESDLSACLEAFGAPLWVWERGATGAALAYGWYHERNLGFSVSAPVRSGPSASFGYGQVDERMRGVILFFDADWRLVDWRTGLLADLTREVRRPPATLEEIEQAEADEDAAEDP